MSISLFKHNRTAYESAVSMLEEVGKAAIIHPTGTGKSFIGFKLCQDNPKAAVLWLSPSEYIFKTQAENLQRTCGGYFPDNITFCTYARLMGMEAGEMAGFCLDYIILDEFHRCGAEQWGTGVKRLLALYPQARILGLTATNIRYLDNQRDMAQELFEGNIASEISLGEAVARGILSPPAYVTAIYSWKEDLDRHKARVEKAQNKAARHAGEKYLEALRRALEKADGLDVIFQKHMARKEGKYIVFCSNAAHMDEMISHVPQWFLGVDSAPRIYRAYSSDPQAGRAFAEFKADESRHLKLLFCIDMLNEGIHVENISGVILFRPTISPIIYKQQIGRALSAGMKKGGLIIDVVNNGENLYSAGFLEEEMQAAISYYRYLGREDEIVNRHFTILDEARECRELFSALDRALALPWNQMHGQAVKYYEDNGDLRPPVSYQTAEGCPLGQWIATQRKRYRAEGHGGLTGEQIEKLAAIGMEWEKYTDRSWERHFQALREYFAEHGHIDLPHRYKTKDGLNLGLWLFRCRQYRNGGIRGGYLTPSRMAALEEMGIVWDKYSGYWERNFAAAADYYEEHGDLRVPKGYRSPGGAALGLWIASLRLSGGDGLSEGQRARLEEIGMSWESPHEEAWEKGFLHAREYAGEHGSLDVPGTYKCGDGFCLGLWVRRQRRKLAEPEPVRGPGSAEGRKLPDGEEPPHQERGTHEKQTWEKETPGKRIGQTAPAKPDSADGGPKHPIGMNGAAGRDWKKNMERRSRLDELGMIWEAPANTWERAYAAAKAYYEEHENLDVRGSLEYKGFQLGGWLARKRREKAEGRLTEEQIRQLDALSMDWSAYPESAWEEKYSQLKAVHEGTGQLSRADKSLRDWLQRQRKACRNGKLTGEQIEKLKALGFQLEAGLKRA